VIAIFMDADLMFQVRRELLSMIFNNDLRAPNHFLENILRLTEYVIQPTVLRRTDQ
jgi:hypothetical protein